ncbi:MAG: transcriptional regulator [Magnetococcales bacterium]|nr:transcriptional regulator [Magnetococcales bacterium]
MSTFFNRLCEERRRLGKNQIEFAGLGGVSRETQVNYEAGSSHPTSKYLMAIANAGADVNYILTGVKLGFIPKPAKGLEDYPEVGAAEVIDAVEQLADHLIATDSIIPPKKLAAAVRMAVKILAEDARERTAGKSVVKKSRLREIIELMG